MDYEKFNKMVDIEGLKKDVKDASENNVEYKTVPVGTYEVSINKMELGESKNEDPMVKIWFKILEGEYKGSLIFYNQVITKGFQIHLVDELLRSLESGLDVEFEDYCQYAQLLLDIHEAIDGKFEYAVEYGDNKGFPTFKITEVYELED